MVECRVLEENGSAPRRRRLRGVRLFNRCRCLVFIWTTPNQLEDLVSFHIYPYICSFYSLITVRKNVVCHVSRYVDM